MIRRPTFLFFLLTLCLFAQQIDWSKARTLTPGIKIMTFETTEPRLMKGSIARIDLSLNKFDFTVTPRAPEQEWGKPMKDFPNLLVRTIRRKTRDFMMDERKKGKNMVLAVNSSPWTPWQSPWNHREACNLGLIVRNGVMVSPVKNDGSWCFVEYKDGKIDLTLVKPDDDLSKIKNATAGFFCVMENGNVITNPNHALAPRTGYGLSKDRKYLFLIVIDGRQQEYSRGATTDEVGSILKNAGADKALNMDGGGSTTMLTWENGNIVKWNHHRNDAERTVGCNLGVVIKK